MWLWHGKVVSNLKSWPETSSLTVSNYFSHLQPSLFLLSPDHESPASALAVQSPSVTPTSPNAHQPHPHAYTIHTKL